MKRKRGIIQPATPGDRISNLPDEVIHDILARLKSSKQPARLAILSKRWNRLWRSYPAIDFNYNEYERPITVRSLHPFLTAAAKKFSNLRHASAVRIQLYGHGQPALLDKLLGFVAKDTPEVRLNRSCNCDCDYIAIGPTLFKGDRFRGLKVVKLQSIHFPSGSSVSFGAALQVLSLKLVRFPDKNNDGEGDRILNRMIGSASCLETLTLKHIRGIGKFRIRNCLNLKTLKAGEFRADSFEISGAESLETLHVCYTGSEERFQVSLSPNNNVKVVHIGDTGIATNEEVNKFISKFPRLELLKLNDVPLVPRLKINVGNHKFLRSIWIDYTGPIAGPKVIEIDGPLRLSKLVLNMKGGSGSPDILINQAVQVSVRWRLSYQIHWHEFKQFLANLISRFRLTTLEFVHFQHYQEKIISLTSDGDNDQSPIPTIEHLKFPPHLCNEVDFMNNLFRNCHPKILSFTETRDEELVAQQNVLLQNMWKYLASKSWNHQPKDVKMMKRVKNEDDIEEDREIDLVSFLDDPQRCWIVLDWH